MGHGDTGSHVGLDLCEAAGHITQGGLDGSSPAEFVCLAILSVPTVSPGIQRLIRGQCR